jgi:hypothetical protein
MVILVLLGSETVQGADFEDTIKIGKTKKWNTWGVDTLTVDFPWDGKGAFCWNVKFNQWQAFRASFLGFIHHGIGAVFSPKGRNLYTFNLGDSTE